MWDSNNSGCLSIDSILDILVVILSNPQDDSRINLRSNFLDFKGAFLYTE